MGSIPISREVRLSDIRGTVRDTYTLEWDSFQC
jgi:hypothetical protein